MKVPAKNNAPPKKYFKVNFLRYLNNKAITNPPIIAGIMKVKALMTPAEAASEPVPSSATTAAVITKFAKKVVYTKNAEIAITTMTGPKKIIFS